MSESSENFLGFFNNKNLQDKEKEVANHLSQLMNTPSLLISPQIIVNKLSPIMEQKKEYKPKPRRLTLISSNECDFCKKSMKKDENGKAIDENVSCLRSRCFAAIWGWGLGGSGEPA